MDGYLGEVKMFAGTYAPKNWAFCDGSVIAIQNYTALFSLLGTQFGGDGRTSFGIPDLRGRVPIGVGTGLGLTPRRQGEFGGLEMILLTLKEIPSHNHAVACDMKTGSRDLKATSENNVPAQITDGEGFGSDLSGGTNMKPEMISTEGGGQAHYNMQPWACLNYIICLIGEFPPRN